jgi:hypothetical protein
MIGIVAGALVLALVKAAQHAARPRASGSVGP